MRVKAPPPVRRQTSQVDSLSGLRLALEQVLLRQVRQLALEGTDMTECVSCML